jgi:hypothetical protein
VDILQQTAVGPFFFQILTQIFYLIRCEMAELSNIILYRPKLFEKLYNVNYIGLLDMMIICKHHMGFIR